MRVALLVVAVAGAVASVFAFQPGGSPANPAAPAAAQPEMPPMPAAIPVPDGPVVKRTELEGGLIAEDIKVGEGYEVKPGGAVVVHYHGTLKDGGKVFDSSFQRGEPIAFPLGGVIQGWQKGVPGMKIGGVRRLTIPSAMGYGERGAGGDIPPNADLVFVIQLIDAVRIEDVKVGEGEAVQGACVAVTTHVIKDAAGTEIEKATPDKPYIWIPGEFDGFMFGLEGMKCGGKRKVYVPKEMNSSPPQLQSTRPQNVAIEIEVDLVAVRNLQHKGR